MAVGVPRQDDLRRAVHTGGHDLPVDPVAEPQAARMPPWRLRDPQATQQDRWLSHDTLLVHRGRTLEAAPPPPTRTAFGPIDTASRQSRVAGPATAGYQAATSGFSHPAAHAVCT